MLSSFKPFKMFKQFKPPPLFLPRVEGDEGRGLNGAKRLNGAAEAQPKADQPQAEIEQLERLELSTQSRKGGPR
jgi:hypothetical protein